MTVDKNEKLDCIDDKPLWDVIAGMFGYQVLMIANELDLFSVLVDKPKSLLEISNELNISERPAEALLLMLVNLRFVSISDQNYKLTKYAEKYLLTDSPTYFGGLLDLTNINTLESLKQAVLSNESRVYGEEAIFDRHEVEIEQAKAFTEAMHSSSMAPALEWPKYIDLSNNNVLLDIGGGSGAHTIGALKVWENLQGINFDIAPVCEVSQKYFDQYVLNSRVKAIPGDFWKDDMPSADVHFYSQIFHDWPEDKCRYLSEKSFASLPNKGKIILHEILFDDDKCGPKIAAAASVAMLNWTEGKQYSGKELCGFLQDVGFVNIQTVKTFGYWGIVIGEKA